MQAASAPNEIVIVPKPHVFSITPVYPRVKPGHQPLVVRVDWSQNKGFWNKVVLKGICHANGRACDVFPTQVEAPVGSSDPQSMLFNFTVSAPAECKFSVEFHRVSPSEIFEVDPGVILQPGP